MFFWWCKVFPDEYKKSQILRDWLKG
jgi:hypothetical protein